MQEHGQGGLNFTRALQALSKSHRLYDLLHEYPMDLVVNLYRAEMENRRDDLKAEVLGLTVAVTNAIDVTIGSGKGNVLNAWLKSMDTSGEDRPHMAKPKRTKLSPEAIAFFSGLPMKPKKD